MSKSLSYNPGLDGLRTFAVGSVIIGHWSQHIDRLTFLVPFASYMAYSGVGLFFVLSGFLITRILLLAKETQDSNGVILKQFYYRRFLRIFPLYYLVLFACLFAGLPGINFAFPWLATYTENYIGAFQPQAFQYVGHFWSLCVEEQFYIIFPFIILFIPNKFHIKTFWILIAVAIVFRLIIYKTLPEDAAGWATYIFTPSCFDCFGLGAIAAYYYLYNRKKLKLLLSFNMWYIVAGMLSVVLYILSSNDIANDLAVLFLRFFVALFCVWVIGITALRLENKRFGLIVRSRPVVYLGKISYGLYVYHNFMPLIFEHVNYSHKAYLYPVVTVAISALSFHLYEHPINMLKNRLSQKKVAPVI